MDAGPETNEVLYLQKEHRSSFPPKRQAELDEIVDRTKSWSEWDIKDNRVLAGLEVAGFRNCYMIQWIKLDWPLIWALVDRWRPETNTFHMRVGEMTVTLQDVAVILGLPVGGFSIMNEDRHCYESWGHMMDDLLGQRVNEHQGAVVNLQWLREHYEEVPENATDEEVEYHVRAYILWTIGKMLMPDSSKASVSLRWLRLLTPLDFSREYSWGAAVLAHLYDELTKAALKQSRNLYICGLILQLWVWERIPVGRPDIKYPRHLEIHEPLGCRWSPAKQYLIPSRNVEFYRNEFDMLEPSQVIWEPYSQTILNSLPPICIAHQDMWRAKIPLFKMKVVHMHFPDRVMKQFGLVQHIPDCPMRMPSLVGKSPRERSKILEPYIIMLHNAVDHVQTEREPHICRDDYLRWYWRITRRWILTSTTIPLSYQPRGPIERELAATLREIIDEALRGMAPMDALERREVLAKVANKAKSVLCAHRMMEPEEVRVPSHEVVDVYRRTRKRRGTSTEACTSDRQGADTSEQEGEGKSERQGTDTSERQGASK